jgi:hypothetical protein
MKIKAIDYIPGARYAYPAVSIELPETPFSELVKGMSKNGWSLVAVRRSRALFRRYSGRQEWRRYIALQA